LPLELKVSAEFTKTKYLIVEGNVDSSFNQEPTIALEDSNGDQVFSVAIEPSFSNLELRSNARGSSKQSVSVDFGSAFLLYVGYDLATYKFDVKWNDKQLGAYVIPATDTDLIFSKVHAFGGMTINYIGFGPKGFNPAIPVGTKVTYGCPEGYFFLGDIYRLPIVPLVCEDDGQLPVPDVWPTCYDREDENEIPSNASVSIFFSAFEVVTIDPSDPNNCEYRMLIHFIVASCLFDLRRHHGSLMYPLSKCSFAGFGNKVYQKLLLFLVAIFPRCAFLRYSREDANAESNAESKYSLLIIVAIESSGRLSKTLPFSSPGSRGRHRPRPSPLPSQSRDRGLWNRVAWRKRLPRDRASLCRRVLFFLPWVGVPLVVVLLSPPPPRLVARRPRQRARERVKLPGTPPGVDAGPRRSGSTFPRPGGRYEKTRTSVVVAHLSPPAPAPASLFPGG